MSWCSPPPASNALDDASHTFAGGGGASIKTSYAASSQLAKQIESGAPADIFISADLAWMDYVQKRNLIQPATRKNLLGNQLVLVAPADSNVKVDIKPGFDLAGLLNGARLAMADPASLPAGKYGKAALQKLGVWDAVQPHVAGAENVRAALLFVDRKETPLGIVYTTDAASDPKVKIVGIFPEDTHPPIIYPAALTTTSKNPDAAKFLQNRRRRGWHSNSRASPCSELPNKSCSTRGRQLTPLDGAHRFTAPRQPVSG